MVVSLSDADFQKAMEACSASLARIASYRLEPALDKRIQELGERKEFLSELEREELLSLVSFTEQRSVEKLEAQAALKQLRQVFPGLVNGT